METLTGLVEGLSVSVAVLAAGLLVLAACMAIPLNPNASWRWWRVVVVVTTVLSALGLLTWAITVIFEATEIFG